MNIKRLLSAICLGSVMLSSIAALSSVGTVKADAAEELGCEYDEEVKHMQPKPCTNITLNAYLVPLFNEELRKEQFKLCRDADIDILSHIYVKDTWVKEDHTESEYKKIMQEASAYGLKVLTREAPIQDAGSLALGRDELVRIANGYKDIPGFGGFFITDEPYNPTPYAAAENALRSACPDAFINVNFLPRNCYPEGDYIGQLTDYGSLLAYGGNLSLDVYCFGPDGGVNESALFLNYDDIRRAGLKTGCDTAVYVQSVGSPLEFGNRRPSGSDLRYNMMAALAYGIKEIKFFTWGTPPENEGDYTDAIIDRNYQPTDLYDAVCEINAYIHKIGKYIAACDAVTVYHSKINAPGAYKQVPNDLFIKPESRNDDVVISLMQERGGDKEYVMIVNKDFKKEQTVTFTLDGVSSLEIVNKSGNLEALPIKDHKITLTLAAGDGAVLKLPKGDFITVEPTVDLAQSAIVTATSSESTDGNYIYNTYDGVYDGKGAKIVSSQGGKEWITFDFGAIRPLNRVDIYPMGTKNRCGSNYPRVMNIRISTDGKTWKTVRAVTDNDITKPMKAVPVFRFDKTEARFVRVEFEGFTGAKKFCEVGDIRIYNDDGSIRSDIPTLYQEVVVRHGENLALNKPVVDYSSTTDVPEWTCHHSYINDGDKTHAWASALFRNEYAESDEWITVDLLDVYNVNKVVLTPRSVWQGVNVFPEDYRIDLSADGETFVTVKEVKGDNDPQTQDERVLEFAATPARFVRLYATKLTYSSTSGGGYAIEINEMEVYADSESTPGEETTAAETEAATEEATAAVTTTEAPTEDTTTDPTPTEAPEATALAPEATTAEEPSSSESASGGESAGCRSSVSIGCVAAMAAVASLNAAVLHKRKEEKA